MQNRYFAMRHGHSLANEACVVVSHPQNATIEYGLMEEGRREVKASVQKALRKKLIDARTFIYSSPFRRAVETAEIVHLALGATKASLRWDRNFASELCERNFGTWELKPNSCYAEIWARDARNESADGVEPVSNVEQRVTSLVARLDRIYSGQTILLVSHGDPLQILQSAFKKMAASMHRTIPHLETAEIRELT